MLNELSILKFRMQKYFAYQIPNAVEIYLYLSLPYSILICINRNTFTISLSTVSYILSNLLADIPLKIDIQALRTSIRMKVDSVN